MSSFAFIFSSLVFDVPLPYALTEDFSIAPATQEQLDIICPRLDLIGQLLPWAHLAYSYDMVPLNDGTTTHQAVNLPREQWRFWVINFEQPRALWQLEQAFLLQKEQVVFGMIVMDGLLSSRRHSQVSTFNYFNEWDRFGEKPHCVTEGYLNEVRRIHRLLTEASVQGRFVAKAMDAFCDLGALPDKTAHHIVFSFAIIESLLTHAPNDKVQDSGVTQQLRTKLALLERRFKWNLDFSPFKREKNESDEKFKQRIWGKLYGYRSFIAHGNRFVFKDDFGALNSHEHALTFLRELTKRVLVAALEEPELIEDLKAV
jgi:Apea-like HEPN